MVYLRSAAKALWLLSVPLSVVAQDAPIKTLAVSSQQQAAMGVNFAVPTIVEYGTVLVSASATVPPDKQVVISAPYPGHMTRMLVDIGEPVQAGADLGNFTSPQMGDARRLLLEATSDQRLAKEALARDTLLFKEGIIPQARLNIAKAKAENANAMLMARQSELKSANIDFDSGKNNAPSLYATGTIKSPISGTVVEAHNLIGQRVDSGTVLFRIADTSSLLLEINTSGQKSQSVQIGDEVTIPSRSAKAKVIAVSQAVNASQAARIRAAVVDKGSLRIGEIVTGSVSTRRSPSPSDKPIWQVPSRAITNWKGQSVVFVYTGNSILMLPASVISSNDDVASIQANIPAQGKVAITGVASLKALAQKGE